MTSYFVFRSCSGGISEFLCFSSDLLEFWYGWLFSDATYKNKDRSKVDNDLSQKVAISIDFSQKCTKHSSTKALQWQQ